MSDLVICAAQSTSLPGDVEENVARHLRMATIAAERDARLLVFPELSLTGYEPTLARTATVRPDDPRLEPLLRLAREARMTLVVGAPLLDDKGDVLIASLSLSPDGAVSVYSKQHLHPGEERVFVPGPGGPTLQVEGRTVALAICAEIAHGEHAARARAMEAEIYAASVFITPTGYDADARLLAGYARRHGMLVVMANYAAPSGGMASAGRSAIWSGDGALVVASPGAHDALVVGQLREGAWTGVEILVPA